MTVVRVRRVRVALRAAVLGFAVACTDSAAPTARPLTGSWGAAGVTFASFSLTDNGGRVTGHGWTSNSRAIVVEGTRSGQDVVLTLSARVPVRVVLYTFRGRFASDALEGDVGSESTLVPAHVSLVRVDTVAESFGRYVFSGAVTAVDSTNASFNLTGGVLSLMIGMSGRGLYVIGPAHRLTPGTYAIGVRGSSAFYGGVINNDPNGGEVFESSSGELKVDVSSQRALIGSVRMEAIGPGGRRVTVTATYSASCYFASSPQTLNCQPES